MTPDWAWATHQPLIQAVTEIYKPAYVLEIGIGLYSTPYFLDSSITYQGIEQDANWIKKVLVDNPGLDITHHDLKGVAVGQRYNSLTSKQKYETVSFYSSLKFDIQKRAGIKVLFVDCFASTRMYALNTLIKDFDIIIYHDTHPKVFKVYGYDKVLIPLEYDSYQLMSKTSWTDMLVKASLDLSKLDGVINKYIKQFDKRWKVKSGMRLNKQILGY